ncbi:MAG TPA: LysR substrate-binding domain-containing protein [Paraburkholderia sp.]|jgi:LysR family transcriptional regulator for bpeEF and oprC|nr:LysR substrate-binding domain-containing protein [Paraburkholderia sp.]
MDQLLALRVFVRIADAGGFSKAADSLNMPKPTVTKLIQDLETHLRVKLLQRSTRKVTVTEEGRSCYERATRILADVDEMDALFADARGGPRGRLRVDIGSSLANQILLPQLPAFRRRYPDIQLQLGVSDREVDLIADGVDCVIRGGELTDTSLVARRIASLDWGTYASASYLAGRAAPEHPDALRDQHELVGYFSSRTGRSFTMLFERGDERIQIDPNQRVGVSVNESTAHLTALASGLGIGQTFGFMARPRVASGELIQLLGAWTRPLHPMHIVFPRAKHDSARMRAFVDWVLEVFEPYDCLRDAGYAAARSVAR